MVNDYWCGDFMQINWNIIDLVVKNSVWVSAWLEVDVSCLRGVRLIIA